MDLNPPLLRAPGTIGADYGPQPFVEGVTQDISGRSFPERTEDTRRTVHRTEKTIYTDK